MSAAATGWRPVYDAGETVEQFAQRQRQAFAAFELAWRDGRVSLKLKGYYDQVVRDVGANAYAWWTEARWAEAFGVSASTIKRVLARLTKAGLIRRERQFGASSRTYLTVYDCAAVPVAEADVGHTDNRQLLPSHEEEPPSQHDIMKKEGKTPPPPPEPHPAAVPDGDESHHYRQTATSFFETTSDPTISSLLVPDSVKTRHLTFGAAGEHLPTIPADPLTHQVLDREGVTDFVLAPQLAQQAAGELAAVSQYLDTQATVRDRPRLFAWLATHGFGKQLLAGRSPRAPAPATRRSPPRTTPATRLVPSPPEPPPTAHTAVWQQVCDQLRTDGSAAELVPWLTDTVLLDLTATTAVVGTPNVFVRDAVQRHAALLALALAAVATLDVDVTVVVDGFA